MYCLKWTIYFRFWNSLCQNGFPLNNMFFFCVKKKEQSSSKTTCHALKKLKEAKYYLWINLFIMTQVLTWIPSDCIKAQGGHFRPKIGPAIFDPKTHWLNTFLSWRFTFESCPSRMGKILASHCPWLNDAQRKKKRKSNLLFLWAVLIPQVKQKK